MMSVVKAIAADRLFVMAASPFVYRCCCWVLLLTMDLRGPRRSEKRSVRFLQLIP
jgi:hypothetical protein